MDELRNRTGRRTFLRSVGAIGLGWTSVGGGREVITLDSPSATGTGRNEDSSEGSSAGRNEDVQVYEPQVVVRADGVTLDGEGQTLTGPADWNSTAVLVTGDDVTVRNLVLEGWDYGIHYRGTAGGTITGVTATGFTNDSGQVYLEDATGTTVHDCDLRYPLYSVQLSNVDRVTIRDCLLAHRGGDGVGVRADGMTNSRIVDNDLGVADIGIALQEVNDSEILRNRVRAAIDPLSIYGDRNLVEGNSTRGEYGIWIVGNENRIVRNYVCEWFYSETGDAAVTIWKGENNVVEDNAGCRFSGRIEVVADDGVPAFEYRFEADSVEFGPATEHNDARFRNDDGSVTVLGRVGNGYSDDYEVEGLRNFAANANPESFDVFSDRSYVTNEVTGRQYRLEVQSVGNEERFTYEARLLGAVEKMWDVGRNSADRNDDVVVTRDGVVVRGVLGGGYGDSYRVWNGDPDLEFEATTDPENYEVTLRPESEW